jgi:hypothetical protein
LFRPSEGLPPRLQDFSDGSANWLDKLNAKSLHEGERIRSQRAMNVLEFRYAARGPPFRSSPGMTANDARALRVNPVGPPSLCGAVASEKAEPERRPEFSMNVFFGRLRSAFSRNTERYLASVQESQWAAPFSQPTLH